MAGRYKPYPEYKDSRIDWIGKYPASWDLTRVKFESYVKARVGWHGLKSDDFTDEGPYLVTGSDFRGPVINWADCYHCDITRYEQDPYIQLKEGDLLITKDGTIGKVALVSDLNGKATLNSGVFVVRPLNSSYSSRFYFWLLQSSAFTGFVDLNKTGSTIVHLYQETFVNFKYAMPPFDEQLNIADFLDCEIARVDALIEKQQQLMQKLKEKRQAVISHAVTKGLDPNAKMRDSGVEWLGEVPEHWELPKLIYRTSAIGDGLHSTPQYQDGTGNYFVNGNNLVDGRIYVGSTAKEVPEEEYKKYSTPLDDNTVLLSINGTIGNVARYNGEKVILGKSAAYINCSNGLLSEYLLFYLQSDAAQRYFELEVTGTTIFNLSLGSIRRMKICIPSANEQKKIARYCANQQRDYGALITKASLAIELMQERRCALISVAVTGKIDVRDWIATKVNKINKEVAA